MTWLHYMLNAMTRECPAGYHAVRAEQVIKADTELWTILAQGNLKSLRPINDVPALKQAFSALLTDPRVTIFLPPVPSGSAKLQLCKERCQVMLQNLAWSYSNQETETDTCAESMPQRS